MKKKNIILMYIITFLQGMVFYASISTLYRTSNGITLLEMGIIESICSVLIMVFEIPWGIVCDRIGYKKTLIICNFIYFISKIVFYHAHSFDTFLLERILMAFVVSGLSGCDTALIYESVDEKDSTKVFGFYHTCGTLGMILASFMYSMVIKDNIALSGLWTIYSYGLAFGFTIFLDDVSNDHQYQSISLKEIPKCLTNFKQIIFFLIAASLFTETTHTLNTFYNQLQYERVSIPMEYYGYLYMIITLCSLSSASVGKLVKRIKEEKIISILLIIGLITCTILRFTTFASLSILCIALLTIVEGVFFPIMDTLLNKQVIINRATTLSIYSMMMNMGGVVTNIIFGNCADIDVTVAIQVGCIFILIAFVLYQMWMKNKITCNKS